MNLIFRRILIVFFLFSKSIIFAQSPEELVKKDWPKAYAAFGKELKSKPLNFIFVLDVSDKTFGDEIKEAVNNFLKPVKDGDYFNVILLGSTDKTVNLTECAIVSNSKKNDISSEVNKTIFGTNGSNSIRMTELVLNALSCSGASSATPIVFIFSDFVHYENGWSVPGPKFWDPLISKYDKIKKNIEQPHVYCIELPNVDKKAQYLNNLKQIFSDLSTVTCSSPSLLDDKFNDIRAKINKKLLRDFAIKKAEAQNAKVTLISTKDGIQLKNAEPLVYNKIILDEASKTKVSGVLKSKRIISFFPPSEISVEVSGKLVADNYKSEITDLKDLPVTNQKVALMPADSVIPWYVGLGFALFLIFWVLSIIYHLSTYKADKRWNLSASIRNAPLSNVNGNELKSFDPKSIKSVPFECGQGVKDYPIEECGFKFSISSKRNVLCIPFLKRGYFITKISGGEMAFVKNKKEQRISTGESLWIGSPKASPVGAVQVKKGSDQYFIVKIL